MTRKQLTDKQIEERFFKNKPGRSAQSAAQPIPAASNQTAVAADVAAHDQVQALADGYGEGRDVANQLLGQIRATDAAAQFLVTVTTSQLAFVKESQGYKALKGMKTGDVTTFSGTWEDYCALLGRSREQVDEAIRNLNAFGEAALESMQRIGIGYRELRQYRRLPADEQQALIEAAKAGDKDGFLDLAETMVARHASEKKTLEGKLEAKDKVLADKAERINKLESDLDAATMLTATKLPTAALDAATAAALSAMVQLLPAVDALMQVGDEGLQLRARQSVEFLVQQLAGLCDQFNIQVDLDGCLPPPWLDAAAIAALEERDAQQAATKAGKKSKKTEG